ncbi:RDD family protein [Tropicimonas sp. IMCC34043]|uniref:RDD family protein n=1 Tax=Tropicimonas sp. IMCC34043 TaxID=2248760 RepID=UPI000E28253C|nr:RDD family protein [Tropicimonas sp. IMCC34043]
MNDPLWGLPDPDLHADLYADVPVKRAIAWVFDALLVFLLTLLALPFTAFLGLFFYPLLWIGISFLYRVFTIAGGSATWGMRLMSIQLRTGRGERFGPADAIMHTLLYTLCVSFLVPQLISAVLMMTSARSQGLHDMVLGTTAINRSR